MFAVLWGAFCCWSVHVQIALTSKADQLYQVINVLWPLILACKYVMLINSSLYPVTSTDISWWYASTVWVDRLGIFWYASTHWPTLIEHKVCLLSFSIWALVLVIKESFANINVDELQGTSVLCVMYVCMCMYIHTHTHTHIHDAHICTCIEYVCIL